MANPIFTNSSSFNGRGSQQPNSQQYLGGGQQQAPYQQHQQMGGYQQHQQMPYQQGAPMGQHQFQQPTRLGGVMTLDDVIAKSAITLLTVFAAAAASFILIPFQILYPALIGSAIVGLITVLFVARRRQIPVGGVLFYAAVEGVFVGTFSKMMEFMYPGIVVQAVLATFVAAGATLFAYKFFNIRVTPKFRKFVMIGTMAIAALFLVNLVAILFNVNLGIVEVGGGAGLLSIIISIVALGLAIFNLIVDFDYVERGIAAQAPAHESWRAAFGITVTMVWLYIELLRILSYFRN